MGNKPSQDVPKASLQTILNSPGYFQSAIAYNKVLSNFQEENSKKLFQGKSMLCGPTNKQNRTARLELIQKDLLKLQTKQHEVQQSKKEAADRRLIIVKHGERMDRVFIAWTKLAFQTGRYKPYDLNMPMNVIHRANYKHFALDTPITEVGYFESQMIGRTMRMSRLMATQIYTSPALRCVQSARALIKLCRRDHSCRINIEPGLFEYLGWYGNMLPEWVTNEELMKFGYEINMQYRPIIGREELNNKYKTETVAEYYERSERVVKEILKFHAMGNIFILAHAPSIDSCSRPLRGRYLPIPKELDMKVIDSAFPPCCVLILEENTDKTWTVVDRAMPTLSFSEYSNRIDETFFNRT